jgi:hypothetical protein
MYGYYGGLIEYNSFENRGIIFIRDFQSNSLDYRDEPMNAGVRLEFASQTPKAQRASVEPMTSLKNTTSTEFSAKLGISIPHTGVSYRY